MKEEEHAKKNEGLDGRLKRWWQVAPITFSLFLFFIAVAFLVLIWELYNPELTEHIGYLIGICLLIWRISVADRSAVAAEKTAELTEKGNIHERFKNAIEHLGNGAASIRLGGIYALHNLARDVDNYREQVFKILCAHIRETTTHDAYVPRILGNGKNRPTIEVQSILNILFKMEHDREIYIGLRANLEHSNLEGAKLQRADLKDAHLVGANLTGASFVHADLQGAILLGANLCDASLHSTNMRECIFYRTRFQNAKLRYARNLKIEELLRARTLYRATLTDKMKKEISSEKPELLEKPDDEQEN